MTDASDVTGGVDDESYQYDSVGNRTVSHLSANHDTDSANRLNADDSFTYAYDANGNLQSKADKITLEQTTYTYNAENRLIRIDFSDMTFAEYRYDGLGRRIEKIVTGGTTRYIYDKEDILLEYSFAGATNVLVARYVHGPGTDQPLAMQRDVNGDGLFGVGETFVYHADGLGSITEITDETGTVVRAYVYDGYGRIVDEVGTLENPYTYTGREFDGESGLYFFRTRYYEPLSGRFTQEDPIGLLGGGLNFYAYVRGNPVNFIDPFGLIPTCERLVQGGFSTSRLGGDVERLNTIFIPIPIIKLNKKARGPAPLIMELWRIAITQWRIFLLRLTQKFETGEYLCIDEINRGCGEIERRVDLIPFEEKSGPEEVEVLSSRVVRTVKIEKVF